MTLRLGILGGGFGAAVHLPAALQSADVEVVGLATSGRHARDKGIVSGVRYIDGWERLLDNNSLDAVIVALPPALHVQAVKRALGLGLHVLCEKPFGTCANDALDMVSAAQQQAHVLAVNYQFRYEPGILELKRRLDSGEIGELRRVDVNWVTGGRADANRPWAAVHDRAAGGGVVRNLLTHSLDYALWLARKRPSHVMARGDIYIAERIDGDGNRRQVSAEDGVDCWVELDDDVVISAHVTNCQRSEGHHDIVLSGERGTLRFSTSFPFNVASQAVDGPAGPWRGPKESSSSDSRLPAVIEVHREFFGACRGKSSHNLASGSDSLRVQQLTDAVHHSFSRRSFVPIGGGEHIDTPPPKPRLSS